MSVPSSELGPPTPSPPSECVSPLGLRGWEFNTFLWVRGLGDPTGLSVIVRYEGVHKRGKYTEGEYNLVEEIYSYHCKMLYEYIQ